MPLYPLPHFYTHDHPNHRPPRRYQQQADRMAVRHGKRYGVYHCPHCDGFHLTTKLNNAHFYEPLLYVTGE